jgi:hypothetical protein
MTIYMTRKMDYSARIITRKTSVRCPTTTTITVPVVPCILTIFTTTMVYVTNYNPLLRGWPAHLDDARAERLLHQLHEVDKVLRVRMRSRSRQWNSASSKNISTTTSRHHIGWHFNYKQRRGVGRPASSAYHAPGADCTSCVLSQIL